MITISDALALVLGSCTPSPVEHVSLAEARGRVLASDVVCGRDSPPHDKSQVDGYAVRSEDCQNADTELTVLEEITAGRVPTFQVIRSTATRIMTGAPIPEGADAVVMVEHCQLVKHNDGRERVRISGSNPRLGQNIMSQGESMRVGDTVLRRGHRLRAIEIGLLAELGVDRVDVVRVPRVAVLATGNELVPCDLQPAAGQIRNSNGPMLQSLVAEAGGETVDLGIAGDTMAELESKIRQGLESDVMLLSGGVSAGVLDLVPRVLEKLGVQQIFHKVDLKPGKPLWFGTASRNGNSPTLVFGLPGNPVSTLVCFQLFVRPALDRIADAGSSELSELTATLTTEFVQRGDRPTFHPGRAWAQNETLHVEPLAWRGSSDLRTLSDANVLIFFPSGNQKFAAGAAVKVRLLG